MRLIRLDGKAGRDLAINPEFVVTIEGYDFQSVNIKMSDGRTHSVYGTVSEILKKLNPPSEKE